MNIHAVRLVLVTAGALALAACGPGSDNDQPPRRESVPAGPAQAPPQVPSSAAEPPSDNSVAPVTGASSGTRAPAMTFDAVANGNGYITRAEAKKIPWLERNFAACDTNADGRITRAEYDQCRTRLAAPKVQQPNAAASGSTS